MKYLASSFSLLMLPKGGNLKIKAVGLLTEHHYRVVGVEEIGLGTNTSPRRAIRSPEWDKAVVGHEGTAQALSAILGVKVVVNRESISLDVGDVVWVVQPTGGRITYGEEIDLPELTLFEVSVLGEPQRQPLLEDYDTEVLLVELGEREDSNPQAYKEAEERVRDSL